MTNYTIHSGLKGYYTIIYNNVPVAFTGLSLTGFKQLQYSTWVCTFAKVSDNLKEVSHEIEMGCLWYGWKEPYLEMNL